MSKQYEPEMSSLALGKPTEYASVYSPELLQGIPRHLARDTLGLAVETPFVGKDVWHAYELSWLNAKGKPMVALARCVVDANSVNIVESKSFKLYLNSLNQTRFASSQHVVETLQRDLSKVVAGNITIELFSPDDVAALPVTSLPGTCLDAADIEITEFELSHQWLSADHQVNSVTETVHSHLLKSNCLITNQPDWASIIIDYQGAPIDHEGLLRYLISFRQHNEFHEQCVERIFNDIQTYCCPHFLAVQALYTRRGGLDISPYRCSKNALQKLDDMPYRRINRQ